MNSIYRSKFNSLLSRICRGTQIALALLLAVVPNFFLEPCCCIAQDICCCVAEQPGSDEAAQLSCCTSKKEEICCSDNSSCQDCSDSKPCSDNASTEPEGSSKGGCKDCGGGLQLEPFEPRTSSLALPSLECDLLVTQSIGTYSVLDRIQLVPLSHQRRQALLGVWIE